VNLLSTWVASGTLSNEVTPTYLRVSAHSRRWCTACNTAHLMPQITVDLVCRDRGSVRLKVEGGPLP
jgi:hypothetical protein